MTIPAPRRPQTTRPHTGDPATCQCPADRQARRRARLRAQPTPHHVHGTAHGYRDYGCRCEPCTTAATAATNASRRASAAA